MKLLLTADLHCDESKLQFILSSDVDAVLVAGDLIDLFSSRFYRFQKSRVRRWYQELLVREKQLVWSSGNHDFHDDEMTPILIASPEWMTKCGNISDGQTGVHEKNGLRVAITTVPWPVTDSVDLPQLRATLMRIKENADNAKQPAVVTIVSDQHAKYSRTIDVLNALASAKITNVTFNVNDD